MNRILRISLLASLSVSLLVACGDDDSSQVSAPKPQGTVTATEEKAVQLPAEVPETTPEKQVAAEPAEVSTNTTEEIVYIPNGVVYQEAIYKDWPYTEAPVITPAAVTESIEAVVKEAASTDIVEKAEAVVAEAKEKVTAEVEEAVEKVAAVSGDKPYQVIDGKISENALNGWRTYNGGGCGTCHGKGGIGAVGPNLATSVKSVLSKEEFMDVVVNGRSGTMMRPHKTNKRVMDNLEDLYVYLLARGDDVLGPGNLIKMPLGK